MSASISTTQIYRTYHCHEPVGKEGSSDRPIEEQSDWDDGLRSDPILDMDEDEQKDETERYRNVDQWVVPRDDVSSRVQA